MKVGNYLKAYFVVLSTIIGLGVFVLPYTFSQSGFYFWLWAIFWFFIFLILHLLFGEILFQTEKKHNLPGLAGLYLHPYLKHLVWIFDYFGILGVFSIYFLALGKFWLLILPLNPLIIKISFALFNIYFILKEMPIFTRFETVLSLSILALFLVISFFLLPHIDLGNISLALKNSRDPFLPYGILLFAFSGTSALPIVYDLLGKDRKKYFTINLLSLFTILVLYLVYAFVVVGFLGFNVSEESLQSLSPYFPKIFLVSAIILVTLNITFVDLAFYLKRGLIYDYGLSKNLAHFIISLSILLLAFWEPLSLIPLISLVSEIFLGFNLLVISVIYLKLKEKIYFKIPVLFVILLSLIFILGIIHGFL